MVNRFEKCHILHCKFGYWKARNGESKPVTQASDAFEPLAAVVREYHGMAQALLDLFRRRAGLVEDVYAAQVCCVLAGRWKRARNI
jgi:hypothetical protein